MYVGYQVAFLVREHADGLYPLRRPHLPNLAGIGKSGAVSDANVTTQRLGVPETTGLEDSAATRGEDQDGEVLQHEFSVCIRGVRGLGVEPAVIWGEADCYVQYHFPTVTSCCHGNSHLENGEHHESKAGCSCSTAHGER